MNLYLKFPMVVHRLKWHLLLSVIYFSCGIYILDGYINWLSASCILGFMALALVTKVNESRKGSLRFAFIAIGCCMLAIFVPVKTIAYLAICSAIIFLVESVYGKINFLVIVVLLLMSPVFLYLSNVFSFPIRLQLTSWAADLLRLVGADVTVQGNAISYYGNEFTVDPACMGLSMLSTSLLLGMMFIGHYEKQSGKTLPAYLLVILLMIITGLNVVSNLFRIVMLVQFEIMPEHLMHGIMGILCLIIYVILPAFFLVKWIVGYAGRIRVHIKPIKAGSMKNTKYVFHAIITAGLLTISFKQKLPVAVAPARQQVLGYTSSSFNSDIIKLENNSSLVYIKHISGFYTSEHNPMICWTGSGYIFKKVQKSIVEGNEVYTGVLQHNKELLYTTWWYDNSEKRTINQLDWRWDVFTGGKDYSIINITAVTKKAAMDQAAAALRDRRFSNVVKSFYANLKN